MKYLKLRTLNALERLLDEDENDLDTETVLEQKAVERTVLDKYQYFHYKLQIVEIPADHPKLLRDNHIKYLLYGLSYLNRNHQSLDSSRPWLCYWTLNALSLFQHELDSKMKRRIVRFLSKCQHPDGGFGGGPMEEPHLAATYAAVNALCILATEEAYAAIDRQSLAAFLWRMRRGDGSFAMHRGGEVDIRGIYCAASVAALTNLIDADLFRGAGEWIVACQTYEGGFAGIPEMEAHGGYTFCGLAALRILGMGHLCDRNSLMRWLVYKQLKFEGGFRGRGNKLVDTCYSFWQGACFGMIYDMMDEDERPTEHLFDNRALQEYILICCQHGDGGLIDKPGKNRDVYHSSHAISGLSLAQHFGEEIEIVGTAENLLERTNEVFNIRVDLVKKALLHFGSQPVCKI